MYAYQFWQDGKTSHCGIDVLELTKGTRHVANRQRDMDRGTGRVRIAAPNGSRVRAASSSSRHYFVLACTVVAALTTGEHGVYAQSRDGLLNGAAIGAAVGAGAGVAFTHAVRDSDLVFSQYARGALIFGAIGAGVGLGIDALLNRSSPAPGVTPKRVMIAPTVWRDVAAVSVKWRW